MLVSRKAAQSAGMTAASWDAHWVERTVAPLESSMVVSLDANLADCLAVHLAYLSVVRKVAQKVWSLVDWKGSQGAVLLVEPSVANSVVNSVAKSALPKQLH